MPGQELAVFFADHHIGCAEVLGEHLIGVDRRRAFRGQFGRLQGDGRAIGVEAMEGVKRRHGRAISSTGAPF